MLLYGLSSSNEAVYTQTFKIVCKAIKKESAHHGRISHSVSKIINFLYKDGGSLLKSLGYSIFKNISSAVGPEKFYISSSKILQQFSVWPSYLSIYISFTRVYIKTQFTSDFIYNLYIINKFI